MKPDNTLDLIPPESDNYDITAPQQKLLSLALRHSAQDGEWCIAAIRFIESLRKDGIDCESFLFTITKKPPIIDRWLDYTLWFGKHKGKKLREIDTKYLHWLSKCDDLKGNTLKAVTYVLETRDEQST